MKFSRSAFELRNLFRNVYFWLAAGGTIFLIYVAIIAVTFLPRSTSEVSEQTKPARDSLNKNTASETPPPKKKGVSTKGTGNLSEVRFDLIEKGGWVDSDDRKMTVVIRVFNLAPAIVSEIIRAGGIELEIDGEPAEIINSEPYQKTGFLTRAKAVLSVEKFGKFTNGERQNVEIKTVLRYMDDNATNFINKRFAKQNKTEVEGVKIDWK